ncbi:MAG: hypothetical protein OXI33_14490 [Chloroflexota bacterium]|nr:hypothetical protein [Chloroflexota bacterium]
MEIDAIFFLKAHTNCTLAVHVELKRRGEDFSHGQAEAYNPRAECYRDQRRRRDTLLPHDHYLSLLLCGSDTDLGFAQRHFHVVMTHEKARKVIEGYP